MVLLSRSWIDWLTSFLSAAQRTFEILDTQPLILESADTRPIPAAPAASVRFDHVDFAYERNERVVKDLSFEVRPGEHLGVVGKSGSGKTTLINLIARFYDVTAGSVAINGVDVRKMPLPELRRYVGVVLQESFLFRGTIYDNLTYGNPEVSFDAVVEAAKAANAHEFIMRKPLGYDTYIGERGAGLSGGQRQRVSIARALLYDPKLLILDEATSSVDTESEHLIKEALDRMTEGRTTIAIAHRLSTLKNCDRIVVLEGGRLREQGTHDELLGRRGIYYRLVKIQTDLARDAAVEMMEAGR